MPADTAAATTAALTLYVYDHCPFCVRARMPFGLKSIPLDLRFLANDDEDTPISMIGAKMLPILERDGTFMGESLDIVHHLDALDGAPIFGGAVRPALEQWLSDWGPVINALVIPRTPDPSYPEFRSPSAIAYFTAKKEASFGRFDDLLARTDELVEQMNAGLRALVDLLPQGAPGIDDIHLFPVLRSLTRLERDMLDWPTEVATYRDAMSEACAVPLVWDLKVDA